MPPGGSWPGRAMKLTMRTLPAFFGVLELLLRAGGDAVAEAAFQDRLWRPGVGATPGARPDPHRALHVDAELAFQRQLQPQGE